ncbi:BglG family transcriptional antiterminator [Salsuginibacillus halophilus]|uniref:BglG family transcriptional antiterminator n=1 Tax=Salsuginibacillus halophilus TaxID=517424 RepID=A0A2P8HIA0_9BACI|nr:BglG family transcription antiterminator [Salsuginibacillus halophilus]PSL45890.1 BglG family transcriptional antiterminator [Salsuginibacillus halophilus]
MHMYLSARERQMLSFLLASQEGIKVKELADRLQVSVRTIHRDLPGVEDTLSSFQLELNKQSNSGLQIAGEAENINKLQQELNKHEPVEYSRDERMDNLLQRLLQAHEPIKLYSLAKELGVTIATVSSDLNKLESQLLDHDLALTRRRGYGIIVEGSEVKKRYALRKLLAAQGSEEALLLWLEEWTDEEDAFYPAAAQLLHVIKPEVLKEVLYSLREAQKMQQESITDASYAGLIIHLGLAVARIQQGEKIDIDDAAFLELSHQKEYETAQVISQQLEQRLNLQMPKAEAAYVTMHLLGAKQVEAAFSEEEQTLVLRRKINSFLQHIEAEWQVPLMKDRTLHNDLLTHIKPALYRIQQGMSIYNPMLETIQDQYPALYESVARHGPEAFSTALPPEEIGFLVMHIWPAMERIKPQQKLHALVVCSSGLGTSKMLAARLQQEIPEIGKVSLASVLEIEQGNVPHADLVVSTVPLKHAKKAFVVTPFLSEEEAVRIHEAVQKSTEEQPTAVLKETESRKKRAADMAGVEQLSAAIQTILKNFTVELAPASSALADVLCEICRRQEVKGSVQQAGQVQKELLARQEIGGLAIPGTNVALFHTRSAHVDEPVFTVYDLQEPLELEGMDRQPAKVNRLLVMLAPKVWHEYGPELMSFISTLIIENEEQVRLFETGQEETLYHLLERRFRSYLIEQLEE